MQYWEPGTQYNYEDVVEYDGERYKIIQPHRSQSDWTPPVTPALWGRVPDHSRQQQQQQQPQQYQPPPPQQYQPPPGPPQYGSNQNQSSGNPQTQQTGYNPNPSDEKIHIPHEEKKKHWYDLDDNRKQQLEIGGGLAAGAALLAGGYFAFKEHGKHEEEKKAQTWALQNWHEEARIRTENYHRNSGSRDPATWILTEGKTIPPNAIMVGREHSWNLYICRAFYEGGLQIGKASDAFQKGAVIGFKHEEIHLDRYEILVGNMDELCWVPCSGRLNLSALGKEPVEGGREDDGTRLYIAEAPFNGFVHPGKASEKLDGAYIPYDSTEKNVHEYRVLCYKHRRNND